MAECAPDVAISDTSGAILDAAEQVFADRGFHGATLRAIAGAAGVNLSLIDYHFGKKEQLFTATVERRYDELFARVSAGVSAAENLPGAGGSDIMRGFLAPILQLASTEGAQWRHYLVLLAEGMSVYDVPGIHASLTRLASVGSLLGDAMKRRAGLDGAVKQSEGAVDALRLDIANYLVESAIIFITQDRGLLDAKSHGRHQAARVDRVLDDMVLFFSAGYAALGVGGRVGA